MKQSKKYQKITRVTETQYKLDFIINKLTTLNENKQLHIFIINLLLNIEFKFVYANI